MANATSGTLDYDQAFFREKKCPQCGRDMILTRVLSSGIRSATSSPSPELQWQCTFAWCGYAEMVYCHVCIR